VKSLPLLPLSGAVPARILLGLCCALLSVGISTVSLAEIDWLPTPEQWADERALYQRAAAELDSGAGDRYQGMRDALTDYPLEVDLDFSVKLGQLHDMTVEEASLFMASAKGTPLASRFLVAYLRHKGQDRRWQSFLGVLDAAPAMPELQCYYYRAKLATGNREVAFQGAERLWDVGFSQDDACDPLFDRWIASRGLSDNVIWSRALKAFDAKNGHLIRYVKRFASVPLQRDLDKLAAVYRRPSRVEGDHHHGSVRHADILVSGVVRLAQLSPARAYQTFRSLQEDAAFTELHVRTVTAAIVRHSLFAERSPAPPEWVNAQVAALRDDNLTLIWLRKAIGNGEWQAVLDGVEWLSSGLRGQDRWRYWSARSLDALGERGTEMLWESLATARSFHGFMAADRLSLDYQLNAAMPATPLPAFSAPVRLGVGRAQELMALGDWPEAKEQWRHTLNQMRQAERASLGEVALERGWPDLATDAANAGASWDRLDLRFPYSYWQIFQSMAEELQVDPYELLSLARRESGLYPRARSKVGARGLMQLMPATARSVAKARKEVYGGASSLYDPSTNIALGATYYVNLLSRFEGNRVKALAAYNAGPSRVVRWTQKEMAVDQWVDSIPFGETREYVQAVLAYLVIYRARAEWPASLLTASERETLY
jgi:soluble lytic murein transglycosylase